MWVRSFQIPLWPSPKKTKEISLWLFIAFATLCASCIFMLVGFFTNHWGVVQVSPGNVFNDHSTNDDWWEFGLWQSCRHSDGICIGPRWPAFYMVARALSVLTIFGQLISIFCTIGHVFERIFSFDPCHSLFITILTSFTAVLNVCCVATFGSRWLVEFDREYEGTSAHLHYSFALACVSAVGTCTSSVFFVLELVRGYRWMAEVKVVDPREIARRTLSTVEEGNEEEYSTVTDQKEVCIPLRSLKK